jgi:hypothetical protein
LTLAGEEVNAQVETIRFIHNAYVAGRDIGVQYGALWQK